MHQPAWATVSPSSLSSSTPSKVQNFIRGAWQDSKYYFDIPDPLQGGHFISVPNTSISEAYEFIQVCRAVPKSGLHNPLKNVSRYRLYGEICMKVAQNLHNGEVFEYFVQLIQRTAPKSRPQAVGELTVVRAFFENFCGDQVRFLARGFSNPGDRDGQQTQGYRWPFGAVCVISPFNFPLEIPVLQMMGALFMGNMVTIKPDPKVAVCLEQFLRMMIDCGMPTGDVSLINGGGDAIEHMVKQDSFRLIQFTGSSKIANHLSTISKGKVKIEDAGFDWKILGPDVQDFDSVCKTSDQDAYEFSGQKCSAQSLLFIHRNWESSNFIPKIEELASKRSLSDLTIVPLLTWSNPKIQSHIDKLLEIPETKLLFGGKPLTNHSIPEVYGAYFPTAIYVPLDKIIENFELVTTELFGPLQIVTIYEDLEPVLNVLEMMENNLTAAVVSNDLGFIRQVLGRTINGTTYAGIRARTTGAPQNHWFGPCGDPRAAGIGSPESIKAVWSGHREIIMDTVPTE